MVVRNVGTASKNIRSGLSNNFNQDIMKRWIVLIPGIFAFLSVHFSFAQISYSASGILEGIHPHSGKIFKLVCENRYGRVRLYDYDNRYVNEQWARKDGQPVSQEIALGYINTFESDNDGSYLDAVNVLNRRFTRSSTIFLGHPFRTTLFIDSASGKVVDVEFRFLESAPVADYEPSFFYEIMQDFKNDLPPFKVSSTGKLMNYVIRSWVEEW